MRDKRCRIRRATRCAVPLDPAGDPVVRQLDNAVLLPVSTRVEVRQQELDTDTEPLVSVVVATHERPRFLPLTLACYQHQTYANRELLVLDDGAAFPVAAAAVAACGGRLLHYAPGTPLGAKLNLGLRQAAGSLCLKIDDDDWYAPDFIEMLVAAHQAHTVARGAPGVTCLSPFLYFDLARWELRPSKEQQFSGSTLLFGRETWCRRPFRPLYTAEDTWFLFDRQTAGMEVQRVQALEAFLCIRHRDHLWTRFPTGEPVRQHLLGLPLYDRRPEDLLPGWALARYEALRAEILAPAEQR